MKCSITLATLHAYNIDISIIKEFNIGSEVLESLFSRFIEMFERGLVEAFGRMEVGVPETSGVWGLILEVSGVWGLKSYNMSRYWMG